MAEEFVEQGDLVFLSAVPRIHGIPHGISSYKIKSLQEFVRVPIDVIRTNNNSCPTHVKQERF